MDFIESVFDKEIAIFIEIIKYCIKKFGLSLSCRKIYLV
nr:MAG TPA: hypothetical protein [Caudoviricetes sp.]